MNSALPIVDIYSWIAYLSVQRRIGLCEENCRKSVGKILFKKKKKKPHCKALVRRQHVAMRTRYATESW